jgi:hypothetical protein
MAGKEFIMRGLKPIMLVVGLVILVIALYVLGTSRDLPTRSFSTKPVGASTLSHGGPVPAPPDQAPTDQSPSLLDNP